MGIKIPDKFFQLDSTYYSYTKPPPFFWRLLGQKAGVYFPYSEKCCKWVHIYERMIGIPVDGNELSELQESAIVKSLFAGDWSVLKIAEPLSDWSRL